MAIKSLMSFGDRFFTWFLDRLWALCRPYGVSLVILQVMHRGEV